MYREEEGILASLITQKDMAIINDVKKEKEEREKMILQKNELKLLDDILHYRSKVSYLICSWWQPILN